MDITPSVALTRIDRNVAENILNFEQYERDENLVKKLVFFFAHDFQHKVCNEDIFGNKILDPAQFAKVVGFKNYKSLFNKHPAPSQFLNKNPEQLQLLKDNGDAGLEPLWNSWLDNALYRLRYESLKFSEGKTKRTGKTFEGFIASELHEIRFLKSLTKFYHSGRKKTFYMLQYDDTFINNLARIFIKFDFNIYISLPQPSYQDFYISLITLRDHMNKENRPAIRVIEKFDKLCEMSKTKCTLPEDRKKHINNAIKEINKYHQLTHGGEFLKITWEKNGNHRFKPVLDFYLTEKELAEKAKESYARLDHFVMHNLKVRFRENFPLIKDEGEFKRKFVKWLKDVDYLFELKHNVFLQTHLQCFGKEVKDPWGSHTMKYIEETLPVMADSAFL